MNLKALFDESELTQRITLSRRYGQHHPDHGEWLEQYYMLEVTAIVYPAGQDDLLKLPEGERYLPAIRILSQDPLIEGDIALHQNHRWRLTQLSNFAHYGYYDATAVRHEGTAQPTARGFVVT
ncbi:Uncharacterized protein MCB1EB_1501 [Mycoavidus cysteinexigens]|uniref:Uncharacterized protein n=1 Tax=Mycoavidus cysteinexigens TaxID=1553431 RepID=A0A2Z6EW88_9BURK|nr:hypothetical protein [Mycoavidus cysteinexigens]BBE09662.1 Uncharacterized protein MCB1EB_1501 [Mycoavidus cysteinexigens]GAM51599.1 hypothetical protein EBME_0062 [bacterium endosymbiont of Mortierella elongata FMR23-6]GLR01355.1 hypothetical protein GCM10007934_11670 [Mycoavidus cysteinexigens]